MVIRQDHDASLPKNEGNKCSHEEKLEANDISNPNSNPVLNKFSGFVLGAKDKKNAEEPALSFLSL